MLPGPRWKRRDSPLPKAPNSTFFDRALLNNPGKEREREQGGVREMETEKQTETDIEIKTLRETERWRDTQRQRDGERTSGVEG